MENRVKRKGDDLIEHLRQQVDDYLNMTIVARGLSERDRDYWCGYQWTDDEAAKLAKRSQAPIVVNRIKPKVEGLKGLLIQRRTDPKAYPRNRKDEKASEAVTDALRYVADAVDLDDIEVNVAENVFIEGYGAALIDVEEGREGMEVDVTVVPWDRFYFDPHSRRLDFKDARYMGIVVWMDEAEAKLKFDGKEDAIEAAINNYDLDETLDDRPRWVIGKSQKRIRVCQHFWIDDKTGKWMMAFLTHNAFLSDPEESPYLDEFGEPECPIEAVSAYIDRENQRFGEVRHMIDLQDEINHRRSKALFLLSARQTAARKGAIQDIAKFKREFAKPDGHIEYEGEAGDFQVLQTGDMATGQFTLLQQAQQELDATSFNAQMAGQRSGDASGRAISLLQQGGMMETLPLYNQILHWKKRVYRQIWHRIKQHWTEEKWVRVTDDLGALRWVGLNVPVPLGEYLQETANDASQPFQARLGAQAMLQQMQQAAPEMLTQPITVQNPVPELDMDIILENAPDSINTQAEQFQIIAQLAASRPEVPFEEIVKLSQLRGKEEMISAIEQNRQQALAVAQQAQQQAAAKDDQELRIKAANAAANIQKIAAETGKINMEAINQQIENLLITTNPNRVTSIST